MRIRIIMRIRRIIPTIIRMPTAMHMIAIITAPDMSASRNLPLGRGRARKNSVGSEGSPQVAPSCNNANGTTRGLDPLFQGSQASSDVSKEEGLTSAALYRLMAWLSPAYPVGAYSYSCGIEWAVEAGDIGDVATLRDWLSVMMENGSGLSDGIFLVHAHRSADERREKDLREIAELAAAFAPSKERHLETTAQGRAFVDATRAAWPCETLDLLTKVWDGPVAYPVAVGVAAAGHAIAVRAALHAFLHAIAANWISAGVRLIPLGQTDGQRALAELEPAIIATAERALKSSLADLGGAALRADLASMRHETQYTRLFRS